MQAKMSAGNDCLRFPQVTGGNFPAPVGKLGEAFIVPAMSAFFKRKGEKFYSVLQLCQHHKILKCIIVSKSAQLHYPRRWLLNTTFFPLDEDAPVGAEVLLWKSWNQRHYYFKWYLKNCQNFNMSLLTFFQHGGPANEQWIFITAGNAIPTPSFWSRRRLKHQEYHSWKGRKTHTFSPLFRHHGHNFKSCLTENYFSFRVNVGDHEGQASGSFMSQLLVSGAID